MRRLMVWEPTLGAPDKRTLIEAVAVYLAQHGVVPLDAREGLAEALAAREEIGDTMVASNLAIPHAASPAVEEGAMVFVKLAEPIVDWNPGHNAARFVFTVMPEEPGEEDGEAVRSFFTSLADDDVLDAFVHGGRERIAERFL